MRIFSRISPVFTGILLIAGCNQYATTQEVLDLRNLLTDRTPPSIISPPAAGGGRATNQQITLQWSSKASAGAYIVDVATDTGFSAPVSGSPFRVAAPATSLALTLPAAGRYYWKVRTNYNTTTEYSSGVFDSIATIVYVYCPGSFTTCDDTNQGGSIASPFRTINGALAYAKSNSSITEIQVATRDSGASYNETIVAVNGVSIKGAYTSAFTEATRNLGTNQTKVSFAGTVLYAINLTQSTNIQGFNFIATGAASTIVLVSSCTNAFTLQNNRIETTVSQPGPSYGVLVQNSGTTPSNGPLFTNNVMLSGNITTASSTTAALRLENSSLIIKGNYIRSGTAPQGIANFLSLATGVLNVSSSPTLTNNVIIANTITAAGGFAWSIGYYHNPGGSTTLSNNTIVTLSANGNAYAFAINGGAAMPILINNILFNAAGGYILYEWIESDNAIALQNNALIGDMGGIHMRDQGNTLGPIIAARNISNGAANLALMNDGGIIGLAVGANARASGNLTILSNTCIPFVNYASDDYRLQQNGCTVAEWRDLRYGARNSSLSNCGTGANSCGGVTDDLNAVTRTAVNTGGSPVTNASGYSYGAYEQD